MPYQITLGNSPLKTLIKFLLIAPHPHLNPFRQGIDYGHPHPVQPPGHLIAAAPKFAPGVEYGQNRF